MMITYNTWIDRLSSSRYTYSHFDGVSKFFVADEHLDLLPRLYPACSTDEYVTDFPHTASFDSYSHAEAADEDNAFRIAHDLIDATRLKGLQELANIDGVSSDVDSLDGGLSALDALSLREYAALDTIVTKLAVTLSRGRLARIVADAAHRDDT